MSTTDQHDTRTTPEQASRGPSVPAARGGTGRTLSIIGFVLAGIALFLFPPVFGIAGAIVGYLGHRKGDPLGKWAAGASIAAVVVGMILGFVVFNAASA